MSGTCPSCKGVVTALRGTPVDVEFPGQGYKAVTYNCSLCNTVLGCAIDPIALRTDVVEMTTPGGEGPKSQL